jgi:hypothetical protein
MNAWGQGTNFNRRIKEIRKKTNSKDRIENNHTVMQNSLADSLVDVI